MTEEEKQKTVREDLEEIKLLLRDAKPGRKFSLPTKSKISNSKLKAGYIVVMRVDENGSIDFIREPIVDGTIKLGSTYHAIAEKDMLTYKGKPMIIQPTKSKNPCNPNTVENTTYGQKHIMSRMMNETLNLKKNLGIGAGVIGALIIGGIIIYALIGG